MKIGAKILHLNQFVYSPTHLLVEDADQGLLCKFGVDEIMQQMVGDSGSAHKDTKYDNLSTE